MPFVPLADRYSSVVHAVFEEQVVSTVEGVFARNTLALLTYKPLAWSHTVAKEHKRSVSAMVVPSGCSITTEAVC